MAIKNKKLRRAIENIKDRNIDLSHILKQIESHRSGTKNDKILNIKEVAHYYTFFKAESLRDQTMTDEEYIGIKEKAF
jgi:hypothetical protein